MFSSYYKMFETYIKCFPHTQEDSGTETEDSEIKERVNRRKAANKEKRNKKKKLLFENLC